MSVALKNLQMVDLKGQYLKIKDEIDEVVLEVISSSKYIKGPYVAQFEEHLAQYLGVNHVIGCANGTDALQLAMMALGLKPGDEVIVPSFTFIATAEVVALMGYSPVMVDVNLDSYNMCIHELESAITPNTKAIVPVHLFGQSCAMDAIMELAKRHNLFVIEDNAQAIGSEYTGKDGQKTKAGAIGHIGTTSFFPAKNLGCYGDGGAVFTNDEELAEKVRMIANHGMSVRYYHDVLGVNSRLDAIQASILNVKLKYLDQYAKARGEAAARYTELFSSISEVTPPAISDFSSHVFHQYTLRVHNRDGLFQHLQEKNIPCAIYYPVPMHQQKAFSQYWHNDRSMARTEQLSREVISLPMHTELRDDIIEYIANEVKNFYK